MGEIELAATLQGRLDQLKRIADLLESYGEGSRIFNVETGLETALRPIQRALEKK